jgi:guanylate kinase
MEENGVEYYFLSIPDFKRKIKNGEFIEWEEVYKGQYYGTLKSEMDRIWANGRHVLFDVDVKGGISLKKIFGNKSISILSCLPLRKSLKKDLSKGQAMIRKR